MGCSSFVKGAWAVVVLLRVCCGDYGGLGVGSWWRNVFVYNYFLIYTHMQTHRYNGVNHESPSSIDNDEEKIYGNHFECFSYFSIIFKDEER